jgi:hypothetical protein
VALGADNAFVARALARAAERTRPEPGDRSFLEKRLAHAVAESLADGFYRPELVVRDKKLSGCELPGWSPQPGTIDVAVITPANEPRVVFELKVDDVEWTLWDIYKMVAASQLPTVEAAYLAVAGTPGLWNGTRECVELFDLHYPGEDGHVEEVDWHSRFLFSHFRRSWKDLLAGGSGRLTDVAGAICISAVGRWPFPGFPPYELRAIRVRESTFSRERLPFANDWPVPPPPPPEPEYDWEPPLIPTSALTVAHLPAPDADEDEYHRFALSFNGYTELGSDRRCARIANASLEHWRDSGEVPSDIAVLRGCLFFEQRRWHHIGDSFDDLTMSYLKALIARLRQELGQHVSAD